MSVTQNGKIAVQILSTLEQALDLSSVKDALTKEYSFTFADGDGANEADVLWHDRRTLAAGAHEDLDLVAGTLFDAFGRAVELAQVKALVVAGARDNLGAVLVSIPIAAGLGSPAVLEQVAVVAPGGLAAYIAPGAEGSPASGEFAVGVGTWDVITVTNLDASDTATYDVIVLGVAAVGSP